MPLLRRLAYGVLDREGLRTDELARLTWADVDLVHNRLDLDENKTDRPRSWDMRPDVLMTLTIWRERFRKKAASDACVFLDDEGAGLNVDHLAAQLRDDLARAEVDRAKLFQRSRNRLRMRAHDLQATFVTVSLASGRTWEWCQQRTGHGDAMKQKYRRTSATWSAQRQGDLAPLHLAIPELAAQAALIAPRIAPRRDFLIAPRSSNVTKVHGKGVEPLRLSAAEPKSDRPIEKTGAIEGTRPIDDPKCPEIAPIEVGVGQSWGNHDAVERAVAKGIEGDLAGASLPSALVDEAALPLEGSGGEHWAPLRLNAMLGAMQPHRAAAQVHKGVVTVTGVQAAEGEVVEVIVIRGSRDAERYACAPVTPGEFSDTEDPLGWDGEGWDEFVNEAR